MTWPNKVYTIQCEKSDISSPQCIVFVPDFLLTFAQSTDWSLLTVLGWSNRCMTIVHEKHGELYSLIPLKAIQICSGSMKVALTL